MAKVKFGTIVIGVRGTVAGITFSANANGAFARGWSKGSNPSTALQARTRGRMSNIAAPWASLTPAEKLTWTNFGLAPPETDVDSLGQIYYLTGWAWFARVNQRRQAVGLPITTTLPTNSGVAAPATAAITAAPLPAGPVIISWTPGDYPAGYSVIAAIAAHPTSGLQTMTQHYAQVLALHNPPGSSADVTSTMAARFGGLSTPWTLYLRLYKLRDDGVRSTPTVATCTVT
jgi:hypothetical protein